MPKVYKSEPGGMGGEGSSRSFSKYKANMKPAWEYTTENSQPRLTFVSVPCELARALKIDNNGQKQYSLYPQGSTFLEREVK